MIAPLLPDEGRELRVAEIEVMLAPRHVEDGRSFLFVL
jgi:hypothetical protein